VKNIFRICITFLFLSLISNAFACNLPASVCTSNLDGSFALIEGGRPATVVIDAGADSAVQRVAESFTLDLKRLTGKRSKLLSSPKKIKQPVVLIGVLGESKLIDGLVKEGVVDATGLSGQWEAYKISVVDNPWPKVERALVIVGSNRRGAIYGTYELSEQLGVSPWYWFADVPVQRLENVFVTAGIQRDQPKVKYRGIFINDEDPAFSGWAKNSFGGVNADMYAHVFELILRLKGNYLWPAMWGKSFHLDDPRNTLLADEMGIVMGASHHEPMTRAQSEWHAFPDDPTTGGDWNYTTNAKNLRSFWRGGIERMMSKGNGDAFDSLLTVGMRGDGDEPMSDGTAINLLEKIVADQRDIIEEVTGKPASETPQVWALYKEVQDYYDQGMDVPDDITLLFADDNWGNVRRLPTKELDRSGGYGVYYHFDYVGVPRSYKWQNTVQIAKVWQQMSLSYERGARGIWVVNVGDIKPLEYPLDFFMEMAWNPEKMTSEALARYPQQWAAQTFGVELAPAVAELISRYSQYAARRKPELIDESTFPIGDVTNQVLKGGEFGQYVYQWRQLVTFMEEVKPRISKEQQSAFFQYIEYPVLALSNLYELYYATAWNRRLASHHDARANHFLTIVEDSFKRDRELTQKYHTINGGKWNGMMNQVHMNYVHWNEPTQQTMPSVTRVAGGRNDIPVVFVEEEDESHTVSIEASNFDRRSAGASVAWVAIPDLGQTKASMVAYPQGKPATKISDNVRLEYDISVSESTDLKVSLKLSPSLDTTGGDGVRVGVSLDQGPVKTLVMNLQPTGGGVSSEEQRDWFDAVSNNYHLLETVFLDVKSGRRTLKIWRLDDNVVLQKIRVTEY